MKRFASLSAFVLIGLLVSLGLAPAAQAYPEVVIDLTANRQVLYGGENFTAKADANVTCDWTLEWNGDSRDKGASATFTTKYVAPEVTQVTKIPLRGTCQYLLPDGATPAARTAARAAAAGTATTWKKTIMITVLPRGSASPAVDALPNAGGPSIWFFVAGLGLLVGGGVAIARSKRA